MRSDVKPRWWGIAVLFDSVTVFLNSSDLRHIGCVSSVWAEGAHRRLSLHKDVYTALHAWSRAGMSLDALAERLDMLSRILSETEEKLLLPLKLHCLRVRVVCLDSLRARQSVETSTTVQLCDAAAAERSVAAGLLLYMRRQEEALRRSVVNAHSEVEKARTRVAAAQSLVLETAGRIEQVCESQNTSTPPPDPALSPPSAAVVPPPVAPDLHAEAASATGATMRGRVSRVSQTLLRTWGSDWLNDGMAEQGLALALLGYTNMPLSLGLLRQCGGNVEEVRDLLLDMGMCPDLSATQ